MILHTDIYLISKLQYPLIRVLECKFNLVGVLQVNYEMTTMRIKNIMVTYNKNTNNISQNIGTILIIK
jgi:hypothetical protein